MGNADVKNLHRCERAHVDAHMHADTDYIHAQHTIHGDRHDTHKGSPDQKQP